MSVLSRDPPPKARQFMRANDKSPVIEGSAKSGGGGYYTLKNKQRWDLSLEDCRSLPEAYPKWDFSNL